VPVTERPVSQRERILKHALSLMARRGAEGTSMRDLASATGLNVATLYHYFPSKHDLLRAVLEEQGYLEALAGPLPRRPDGTPFDLGELLADILASTLEVEDFVRLMMGEALRGDEAALAVGRELLGRTQASLERWVAEAAPELAARVGAGAVARVMRALVIGLFFEYIAGTLGESDGANESSREQSGSLGDAQARAQEAARVLAPTPGKRSGSHRG
jgi:AcrR family transcriptional regulator